MKKILITGAEGFLGNYFKNYFHNHHITAPTRQEVDFTNKDQVQKILTDDIDVVIHCAIKGRNCVNEINYEMLNDNLLMFQNLVDHKDKFKKFINIGTGAEFCLNRNIHNAREEDILQSMPRQSYGLSKNIISRQILELKNFFTLRTFGVFDKSESSDRMISILDRNLKSGQEFHIKNDRYFDIISARDLATVVEFYIMNDDLVKDINVVYDTKYKISEICKKYCQIKNLNDKLIKIDSTSNNNYTGNSNKLKSLNLNIQGLEKSLEEY